MMEKNMKIQNSPYLIVLQDVYSLNKGVLRDLLMYKDFDTSYLSIINCFHKPTEYESAVKSYGIKQIDFLIKNKLLLDSASMWNNTNIDSLEIETCTHCNWRCQYCPVSIEPKAPKTMSMDLFREIIDKAVEDNNIKYVTFNSYNEPSLDKYILERIEYLAGTEIKLRLHTNGSMLTKDILDFLESKNILQFLFFNIPSVDKIEFKKMTGSSHYDKIIQHIDYAIQIGLPVELSIQGNRDELKRNLKPIQAMFENRIANIEPWGTFDRAGLLDNCYSQNIYIDGNLYGGCHSILKWINISVDGDCFICSNDYRQKYVWANIQEGSIKKICNSQKAIELRRYVFGDLLPAKNFICRKCITMKRAKLLYRFQKG
jgi:sulfatase maturation enzyme AslB (radical SAM superfamily)